MTLLDIKNHLYAHFLSHASFSLTEDTLALGGAYDTPKGKLATYKEPLLRAALGDMEKAGLVLNVDVARGVWVLTQPIGSAVQQVLISPYTAQLVGDAFNLFARGAAMSVSANKLAITDADINAVTQVAFMLHERVTMLEEQLDDLLDGADGFGPAGGGNEGMPPGGSDPSAN